MSIASLRSPIITLAAVFACAGSVQAESNEPDALILRDDPRFEVFELSNSAGDGTFASAYGTVLLSFKSNDSRYCRAARFPSELSVVLACREPRGWRIEAVSPIGPAEASNPTSFGGRPMREVGQAVEALRAGPDFLDQQEIVEAASKGWLNPVAVDESALDARDILRRTARVYRASTSYVDTGVVKTVYASRKGERVEETRFKTAYVAPFDFRFESNMGDFGNVEVGYIAWMDRDGVDTWFSLKPARGRVVSSIQDALDEAAGISRDTSGMIPGLIIPGTKLGGDIVRLTDAVRLEDATIDGFDCFQVQGFRWPNTGHPTTVWIDKASFLVRRVYEEQTIKGATTRTTWFYEPILDEPVDPELLRFDVPAPR